MGEGPSGGGPSFGGRTPEHTTSLNRLVREVEGPLLNLAQQILSDPIESEDIVVDVLAKILPRFAEFDSPRHFAGYTRSAVRNAAVDRLRQRSFRDSRRALRDTETLRRQRPEDPGQPTDLIASGALSADVQITRYEERRVIRAAVDSLGEPRRTVVLMFYDQDHSYAEIASALGVSIATVKRHLGASRLLLARKLSELKRNCHVA